MCMFLHVYGVLRQLFHWEDCPLSPPQNIFSESCWLATFCLLNPAALHQFNNFYPLDIWRIFILVINIILGGGAVVKEKSAFIPDPFDTFTFVCV